MSVDSDNPKHTDGETRLTNISEGFARQRLEMQYVASLAKGLAQANPDKFSVYVVVNEHLLNIRATTDFDVTFDDEIKPLSLSVGITKWKNGTTTQEVNIRPEHGSWMDDDAVSYRLDVSVGTETEREFERIAEKPGDNVKDVLLGLFDTDQEGQHVSYMDRFAESTMRAKGASIVLENAENLRRPTEFGFTSGMSLSQFREWVEEQARKGVNISGLLD